MKVTLDIKSLLIGAVVTAVLMLAVGASRESFLRINRFSIVAEDDHVFVLDSLTGQVWGMKAISAAESRSSEFSKPRV